MLEPILWRLTAFRAHLPTPIQKRRSIRHLPSVKLYGLSSRCDDEPIRLFQSRDEAEDALREIGEDKFGLAAEAFVTEIEFDLEQASAV